jgi:hypothetical protein
MGIKEDNNLIVLIANRASLFFRSHGQSVSPEFIASELKIVHFELCMLRLNDLLHADVDDFAHDITGIHEHLDILDGSFRNCWSPRFAK